MLHDILFLYSLAHSSLFRPPSTAQWYIPFCIAISMIDCREDPTALWLCSYMCSEGFQLSREDNNRVCDDGNWTEEAPECTEKGI